MKYTIIGQCTPTGRPAPACPVGWTSVGYTKPGSCVIGNVPGDGAQDAWRVLGYQRVCKKEVPSSGDLAVDCCSNLHGISNSVECSTANWKPYSWGCNNVMQERCNTRKPEKDPYAYNWNGMPFGQAKNCVKQPCSNYTKNVPVERGVNPNAGDSYCKNYLRNAPSNNFFYNHDYKDYPRQFPKYSYTTPQFDGNWGYQPERPPYYPYPLKP